MHLPQNIEMVNGQGLTDQELLERVQTLIIEAVTEDRFIDYKKALDIKGEPEKKEFCKDVSGLANANGGHIVYGIEEQNGEPINICGIEIEDLEKLKHQMQNTLNSGLTPRISGIQFRALEIDGTNKKYAFILYIPGSWQAPHMVIKQHDYRVYLRLNSQTEKVDILQIRDMIYGRESLSARVKGFREERLDWVTDNDSYLYSDTTPYIMFHLIPVDAFSVESGRKDIMNFYLSSDTSLHEHKHRVLGYAANTIVPNADGIFLGRKSSLNPCYDAYCQYFRNGIVEIAAKISLQPPSGGTRSINGRYMTKKIMDTTKDIVKNLKELEVSFDCFIAINLIYVKEYCFTYSQDDDDNKEHFFDRQVIKFPEYMTNIDSNTVEEALKQGLDYIWQGARYSRCLEYNQEGVYSPAKDIF